MNLPSDLPQDVAMAPEESSNAAAHPENVPSAATGAAPEPAETSSAYHLGRDIAILGEMELPPAGGSFRAFWERVRTLNTRLRGAAGIEDEVRAELSRAIDTLCEGARRAQRDQQERAERLRTRMTDAIALAGESVVDATSVTDIQEARQDLAHIREELSRSGEILDRRSRQEVWDLWQNGNSAAWQRLNELWSANEGELGAMLDQAREHVSAGRPGPARESIRQFHSAIPTHECSHRSLRRLQADAGRVWREAGELAAEKRAQFVANAGRRVDGWKGERRRHEAARTALLKSIADLENRVQLAPTAVGAAMLRGQLAAEQKRLSRLDSAARRTEERIESLESALRSSR